MTALVITVVQSYILISGDGRLLCFYVGINWSTAISPHAQICKTYNTFRAEEATFLFTVLYILYTVRCYVQLHTIHYHAIITS